MASTAAVHPFGRSEPSHGRVMVVEDNDTLRSDICELLRDEGYTVADAADGRSALGVAAREQPDVVTLDVNMPGLHGYEVCRRLRNEYGYRIAIIFLSGSRTESFDRIAGLEAGGDDYMTKPFDPGELLARIAAQVRRLRSTDQGPSGEASRLTPRQEEIVVLLTGGAPVSKIAAELFISPATVRKHIERIHKVLGVRNRAELVAWAHSAGLGDRR